MIRASLFTLAALLLASPAIAQDDTVPDNAGATEEATDTTPQLTEESFEKFETATLRALDKITGRSTDIQVEANSPVVFGSLKVELKTCFQTPPEFPPESIAFLQVHSTQAVQVNTMRDAVDAADVDTVNDENPLLFSGWMFASSPGLSALEHPVYDIWVINCTTLAP